MRRADAALLVSLDALLREGSVTGAANRLGISQPAMSAQLQRLRDLFGDPVLVAAGNRMVPTERVQRLAAPLRASLAELEGLIAEGRVFDPATAERTFRIAATDYAHSVLISGLIEHLRRTAPGIRIAALPFPDRALPDRLGDDIDCVISSERMMDDALPARRLIVDDFVFVCRTSHPAVSRAVDLDLFCALDHLLVSPSGGGFTGAVDTALSEVGRSRVVVASLPVFLLAPATLRRSDTVAVLPRRIFDLDPTGLDQHAVPLALGSFATFLGWHPRLTRDPGHIWLRNTIADLGAAMRHQPTGDPAPS